MGVGYLYRLFSPILIPLLLVWNGGDELVKILFARELLLYKQGVVERFFRHALLNRLLIKICWN